MSKLRGRHLSREERFIECKKYADEIIQIRLRELEKKKFVVTDRHGNPTDALSYYLCCDVDKVIGVVRGKRK